VGGEEAIGRWALVIRNGRVLSEGQLGLHASLLLLDGYYMGENSSTLAKMREA
jgi:hypothetical protein